MKRKIFKLLPGVAIIAMLMLNVSIVFNNNPGHSGTWSIIGKVLASSGSSGGGWLWKDQVSVVTCGEVNWEKIEYFDEYGTLLGALVTQNGVVVASYDGAYSSSTKSSGKTPARDLNMTQCPDGWDPFCSECLDPCKGC